MDINFAVQSYKSDSPDISSERVLNAYVEAQPATAKKQAAVFGHPGIGTFTTCGAGPIRGMRDLKDLAYAVSGQYLYSIDSLGVTAIVGAGISGYGNVSMSDNGIEVAIANGVNGYTYNTLTSAFVQIADTDFSPAATVTEIDGYLAFPKDGTNQWFISDLLDGQTYDPLLYSSAESNSDRVKAVHNTYGNAAIVGERTIEFFSDTGSIDFPFQRINGATIERGTSAPLAWCEDDNSHFFLGDDRVFYRLAGSQISAISTHAISKEWESYATISDAFAFVVAYGQHKFVNLTFPIEGKTWAFDISNPVWHERTSYDPSGMEVRWRVSCALAKFQKVLVGDSNSGTIGYLDPVLYTEFGEPMILEMISPIIDGKGLTGFMPEFQLDLQTGVGITVGQGSDPQVMMQYSDDGGHSWSSERWRSMRAIGVYGMRVRWTGLGSFKQRMLKIRISDPVKRVIIGARCPGLYFSEE